MKRQILAVAMALALCPVAEAQAKELLVFAAASLRESLTAAAEAFAATGAAKPALSFAASSALARQIENGAPAGIFLSADEQWVNYLAERKLLVAETRHNLLGNELVLIAPAVRPLSLEIDAGFNLAERLQDEKLAMADPDSVPAGRYGRAALTKLGVWEELEAKVARCADVRAALALVERDEARAGIVYRTDAQASRKVVIAGTFPAESYPPIVYPLAVVAGQDSPEARALRSFLVSDAAKAIFTKHGFTVLP